MISDKHGELTAFPNISWVELLPGFAAWKDVEGRRQTGREERYEGSSPLPTIPGSASHRYVSTMTAQALDYLFTTIPITNTTDFSFSLM